MTRIAIVTYYFPPGDQIGGLRPFSLARNLAGFGHDVLVITQQPSPVEEGFRTLVVGRPGRGAAGGGGPAPTTRGAAGFGFVLKRFARKVLAIPDGKTLWAARASAALRREVRRTGIDAVITTGPPHSVHLAGLWGLRRRGKGRPRWIVDMRDLWTDNPYYDYGAGRKRLDALIESDVMRSADAVVAATDGFARSLRTRHGVEATSILTGYDDSRPRPCPRTSAAPIRVVHAGNLYAGRRDPSRLLEAAGELAREGLAGPERLRLTFIGPESAPISDAAQKSGAAGMVEIIPSIPHDAVLGYLEDADALLLVQWRSDLTATEVPGKLFEYLAFRKPIVALGASPDGEVAGILRATGAGRVVNSVAECRETLISLLEGNLPGPDESSLAGFSQSRMAAEFLRVVVRPEVTTE